MKVYPSYFTYILECIDGTFYVGMTHNIAQRIKQHNGIIKGGARYTRQRIPVTLRYYEQYETYKFAAYRERQLKKLTHKQKERLCDSLTIENSSGDI